MKEIGEKLKESRESMGISVQEAADDLKLRTSQIENIEAGNIEAFKDVFFLKYFIRDYSKYLGIDHEHMIDDFNEYLFDYTSKLSIDDIKNAKKTIVKDKTKKIASPYTLEHKKIFSIPPYVIYILMAIVVIIIGYFIFSFNKSDDFVKDNVVAKNVIR